MTTPTNIDSILSVPDHLLAEPAAPSRVPSRTSQTSNSRPTDIQYKYVPIRQATAAQHTAAANNIDSAEILRELGLNNTVTSPPRRYNPPPEKLDPSPQRRDQARR